MNRLPSLLRQHIAALRAVVVFTVVCGIIYPVAMWGIAQVAFPRQANGSMVSYSGRVVGSSLLCQEFTDSHGNPLPRYFQPRPSAGSCNPGSSGAANLGPDNPKLLQSVRQARRQIAAFDHVPVSKIPPDAVTSSGSGLDPDISPAYAAIQVDRVAAARHLPASLVKALVAKNTSGRPLGFLGEPGVNVLTLNIALDRVRPAAG